MIWRVKGLRRTPNGGEVGQSLAGEVVALAIMGLAVAIVLTAISTATAGVKTKQDRVSAVTAARSQAELILDASYRPDPTAVPYPTVAPVPGYSIDVTVEYWTAPSGPFTSVVRNDGLQKITVSVNKGSTTVIEIENYKVDRE